MMQDVKTGKYIIWFGIIYAILIPTCSEILNILGLDRSIFISIGILLIATIYPVTSFIKDNKRIPSKNEKHILVWSSFLIAWAVSLFDAYIATLVLSDSIKLEDIIKYIIGQFGIPTITIIMLIVSATYLALLYHFYGGLAQRQYEELKKKGKI